MTTEYRIIDLQAEVLDPKPKTVKAVTPEGAAKIALDVDLVRSGSQRNLRAKVYYQHPGHPTNMVRLYTKVADRH